jgi:hypothetical protein
MSRTTEQICRTRVATDLGLIRPRRIRLRPNRSHGTKAKSEQAHIEDEEMLDAAEVHYTCFGEFLSLLLLLNQLNEQKRPKNTLCCSDSPSFCFAWTYCDENILDIEWLFDIPDMWTQHVAWWSRDMAKIRLRDAEKIHDKAKKDQTEAEVAFDCSWMCRACWERSQWDQIYAEEG